jgi:Ca2+-binding RTX toxin-like protein
VTLRLLLLPLSLLILALAPGAAVAATAGPGPGGALSIGAGGEQNTVTVSLAGGTFTITDSAGMGANGPCMTTDANTATCPAESFTSITASLGAGDDSFTSTTATPSDVHGGTGTDLMRGGPGLDHLDGDTEDDDIDGGPGNDNIEGGGGTDTTKGGDGNDQMDGGTGPDTMDGGAGDDMLNDSPLDSAADTLAGGDGNDNLIANGGNDLLDGGPGADNTSGGAGTDTATYSAAFGPLLVTLDGLPGDGAEAEGDNIQPDVENVSDGPADDDFIGSDAPNALAMSGGEDYADGGGGVDDLAGGDGRDVLRARDGLADLVKCDRGVDYAIVDPIDTVRSCERFDVPSIHKPRLGARVVLKPLRKGERFGVRGSRRLVPLVDTLGLPLGWRVDSTSGSVRLISAARRGSQSATLSGGAFVIGQRKKRSLGGLTELRMTGGDIGKCGSAKAGARGAASRATFRRLFGRARGRFRTRGRFSTATVRGTEWSVADRCDGTLTKVKRGKVRVRDLVRNRTVVLKAGQRYLARRGHG